MRRLAISVIPVLILLVTASSSAARVRHAAAPKCSPAKSHVLLADAQVELYSSVEVIDMSHDKGVTIHGCAYGHKAYLLGVGAEGEDCSGVPCGGVQRESLAGPLVAYEEGAGGEDANTYLVVVRNLRTGRVMHKLPTGTPVTPRPSWVGIGPTTALVVKGDGAVAWIVETGYPTEYQVHAVDKTGSRVLASGADIDPSSLALAGHTLYWTQGGQPFSASLN
jgi:hypothetical protein